MVPLNSSKVLQQQRGLLPLTDVKVVYHCIISMRDVLQQYCRCFSRLWPLWMLFKTYLTSILAKCTMVWRRLCLHLFYITDVQLPCVKFKAPPLLLRCWTCFFSCKLNNMTVLRWNTSMLGLISTFSLGFIKISLPWVENFTVLRHPEPYPRPMLNKPFRTISHVMTKRILTPSTQM